MVRLIKNILAFIASFFISYFLCLIAVLLLAFCFFRDVNPGEEAIMPVLLVTCVLIPIISIAGAVIGLMFYIKRGRKKKMTENESRII